MADVSQLLESRRSRFGRWAGAALVVCGLHAGGAALALMHWPEEEAEDAAGALTLDLAALPAAVPVDSPDLAYGPLTQDAMQTPEASKKVEEQVADDTPPVDPSPAPEPEVALAKPLPEEKEEPKEEEPKEQVPEKQSPADVSVQQLATAPPRVDVQPAPSSAPSQGDSTSRERVQASWQKALIGHLNRFKRYPEAARSRYAQGEVVVTFTIDRSGQVIASRVTRSSGSPALDEEALAVLKRASPLPAPPDQIAETALDLTLPIHFKIK
jgi:periplasmic protein TonB